MNAPINSLLGPLEAAIRQGSWEDVEDIALAISRLARLQKRCWEMIPSLKHPPIAPGGSQGAKTPLPGSGWAPIKQGNSIGLTSPVTFDGDNIWEQD